LRIERFGEGDDLRLVDAMPARPVNLADRIILEILHRHPRTGLPANHAPHATAAALISPNVASAAANATNTPVRLPVQRRARKPPTAAITSRARLARSGQSRRTAPCEAK